MRNKKVKLDLVNISFSHAHIYGLRSILESSGIELEGIFTASQNTQFVALSAGIVVFENLLNNEPVQELEEVKNDPTNYAVEQAVETDNASIENIEESQKALEEIMNKETLLSAPLKPGTVNQNYETLYLKQTLRSGQNVDFDGNVFIIGDCHPGSEITASGDIIIWGLLSGIAHAGSKGNNNACIRAFKINAIQLRIANVFARKPDRLMLDKNERTTSFTPEEAKIFDGEIKIYS